MEDTEKDLESQNKDLKSVRHDLEKEQKEIQKQIGKLYRANDRYRTTILNKLIKNIQMINDGKVNSNQLKGAIKNIDKHLANATRRLMFLRQRITAEVINGSSPELQQTLNQINELLQRDINQIQQSNYANTVKQLKELIDKAQTDKNVIPQIQQGSNELRQVITIIYRDSSTIKKALQQEKK